MSTRYKGSILSSTAASSSSTAAYGFWKQSEVAQLINSAWPNNDPYWTSVSMLLHGDGTVGSQNNTFIDGSSNAFSITRNGAATQGTFSPFTATAPYSASVSGGSGYFVGTTDSLLTPSSSTAWSFGTGEFTIEFWMYPTALSLTSGIIISNWTSAAGSYITGQWEFGCNNTSSGQLVFNWATGASAVSSINSGANLPTLNTWQHVAIVRSGTTVTIYLNGTSVGSGTMSTTLGATGTLGVGYQQVNTAQNFVGYLSNVRIVKGTAVYTTTFTPPTSPLTAISGTTFLLGFTNAGVIDNAMLNNLVTVGTSQISTTVLKYGSGSLAFSGSGAWLTAPNATVLQLNTGDFTIEGWLSIDAAGVAYAIVSKGAASTGWSVNITTGNKLQFSYTATALVGATSLVANAWYYFAVVRSGSGTGNLKIYLNGTADATSGGAVTDNFNQTNILYVGASRTGTTPLNGYIDELRITKGVARYTANFTAPQQAFPNQ